MSSTGAKPLASDENNLKSDKSGNAAPEGHGHAWHLVAEGDWLSGQRFDIHDHAVLGRDSSCDITIPGTHLSRRHAELAVHGAVLQIRDLGSSNGTYVNDQRVTEAELNPGDKVQFDVLTFRVHGPAKVAVVDENATKVRLVNSPPKRQPQHSKPLEAKQWKTKPTSVGNRDETLHMTVGQKAASSLWTLLAVATTVVTLVAIGYMITQL
jgi:FHA domain